MFTLQAGNFTTQRDAFSTIIERQDMERSTEHPTIENISININDVLEEPRIYLKNTHNLAFDSLLYASAEPAVLSQKDQKTPEEIG